MSNVTNLHGKAKKARTRKPVVAEDTNADAIAVRIPQMAKRLNIGLTKAHEMVRNGEVDTVKIGRTRLISVRSIEALFSNGRAA